MSYKQWNFTNSCSTPDDCSSFQHSFGRGKYLLELWGASGGYSDESCAGKGGYLRGILNLEKTTTLYIFVGQKGFTSHSSTKSLAAWNGGSSCDPGDTSTSICGGGGGSTDIRIGSNELSNRVLIAGAGGGSGYTISFSKCTSGGYGGGLRGGDGERLTDGYGGTGGSQNNNQFFGYGEYAINDGCGGGSGYYGGTSGHVYNAGGGGGSGFAFSQYTASSAKENGINLDSRYYLSDYILIPGNQFMPDPYNNTRYIIGKIDDGYARITRLPHTQSKINSCHSNHLSVNFIFIILF